MVAILTLAACAEERPGLTAEQVEHHKHNVSVYLETDTIPNIEAPWRLDLEMVGGSEAEQWARCNHMGGTLVKYTEATWVYQAAPVTYCEGVDY